MQTKTDNAARVATGIGKSICYTGTALPVDVLIIDDHPINLLVKQRIINNLGLTSSILPNGDTAVDCFIERHPKVVLMNVSMPWFDGLAAAAKIRALESEYGLTPCHIIAVTSYAVKGGREKCLNAGMNDYIIKPISADELQTMILTGGGFDTDFKETGT